jgi:hypothetical protein
MANKAPANPPVQIDIQIERWPIERLIPRANNPRTHSPAPIAAIVAGHARVLAARKLGTTEIPIILLKVFLLSNRTRAKHRYMYRCGDDCNPAQAHGAGSRQDRLREFRWVAPSLGGDVRRFPEPIQTGGCRRADTQQRPRGLRCHTRGRMPPHHVYLTRHSEQQEDRTEREICPRLGSYGSLRRCNVQRVGAAPGGRGRRRR